MAKRLGIVPSLFAQPLFRRFKGENRTPPEFILTEDVPAQLALKLRENTLDAAFLSPIDYARDYAMYSILPRICVSAQQHAMSALVLFKEGLRSISTLAVSPSSGSEIVLASIIFAEQFGGPPSIVPFLGSVEDGFRKADAVLCSGDEALQESSRSTKLDLIEEWFDLVDAPFTHGIWVTRREGLTAQEVASIISHSEEGLKLPPDDEKKKEYFDRFQYQFDDNVKEGLNAFFRLAYFHGILMDIPDVRVFSDDVPQLPEQ